MKILAECCGMLTNWRPEIKEAEVPDDQYFHEIEGEKYIVKGSLNTIKLIKILEENYMINSSCLLEPGKYTHRKAALMIKMAELAYDIYGRQHSIDEINKMGFIKVKHFEDKKTDTQCYVASNDESIVIVFRGSESKMDWKTNFQFNQTETQEGKIHKGFYEAVKSVELQIHSYLNSDLNIYEAKDIYVTGHSLGAALCSIFCLFNRIIIESGWAFGSPRWASIQAKRNFNKEMKGKFFRIVYNNDIVCRIPFRGMPKIAKETLTKVAYKIMKKEFKSKFKFFLFRHVKSRVYITAKGTIRRGFPVALIPLDRFWGRIRNFGEMIKSNSTIRFFDGIDDHQPSFTFNALAKAAGENERMMLRPSYNKNLKRDARKKNYTLQEYIKALSEDERTA